MTLVRKVKNNTFLKNIVTLSLGTIFAQLILFFTSPIITRIYTAEQFGAYTLVVTLVSMFTPVVNAKYDMGIVVADDDKEASALTVGSLGIQLSVIALVGTGLAVVLAMGVTSFSAIGLWCFMALPLLWFNGIINILSSYNNRHKQFKIIASVTFMRSLIQAAGQIIFGMLKMGMAGLLLAQLLSTLMGIARQAKYAFANIKDFLKVTRSDVISALKKYKNQALFSTPASLINAFSYSVLNIFIGNLYGLAEVGYYYISYRLLGMPIQLISMNVAKVYLSRATEERKRTGKFVHAFRKTLILLTTASIPMFFLVAVLSPKVIGVLFGPGWEKAGYYISLLTPMFASKFIVTSLTVSFVVAGKQKYDIFLQIGFFIESVAAYILALSFDWSITTFLLTISILYSVNYLAVLYLVYKSSKHSNPEAAETTE